MNKVEVITDPAVDVASLEDALQKAGVYGFSVADIWVMQKQGGTRQVYRGVAHVVGRHAQKLKIEILCNDDLAPVVEVLKRFIPTDQPEKSAAFVLPVSESLQFQK